MKNEPTAGAAAPDTETARALTPPGDDRRYVDRKTFSRMFDIGKTRLYRLVKAGKLTKRQLDGRSRFSVEEGEAYMLSLPTGPREPPKSPKGKGKPRRS
jgi:hypothetical protein